MAFLTPVEGKDVVNHKDGNKTNNNVSNLEWCTVQENTIHSYKMGLQKPIKGSQHGRSKFTETQITEVCELLTKGLNVENISEKTGVSVRTIQSVRARKNWTFISDNYEFSDRRFKDKV